MDQRRELHKWAGVEDGTSLTLAVVFTDIIDSTALARAVGDKAMFDLLVQHFGKARFFCDQYGGFEIKLIGDGYMVAFRAADSALKFALAFRQETGDPRISIRVGIHVGRVRIWEGDIYGLMVNYAARLLKANKLDDEGIYLSADAKRDIQAEYGTSPSEFGIFRVFSRELKGFDEGQEIWQIVNSDIRAARELRRRNSAQQKEGPNSNPKSLKASKTPIQNDDGAKNQPDLGELALRAWQRRKK